MIKRMIFVGVVLLVAAFISTSAYAGGSGNCIEPLKQTTDKWGLGIAFEHNYADSRLLELMSTDSEIGGMTVTNFNQVLGKVILGKSDECNVYAKIGGASFDLEFTDKSDDSSITLGTDTGLYGGVGINVLKPYKECKDFTLNWGYDLQINGFFNSIDELNRRALGTSGATGDLWGAEGKNSVYMTAKYDIDGLKTSLIPYLGVYHSWILMSTYDDLKYTFAGVVYEDEIEPNFDLLAFGPFVGIDVEIAKHLLFNIEGRLVGETSITSGATLKF